MRRNSAIDEDDFDEEPELMEQPELPKRRKRNEDDPYYESPEDQLYKVYGIRASLPIRTKVESLYLVYRLTVQDIANLLTISHTVVQDELEALNEEWRNLGRPLSPEERELQRGRYIAQLDRTIQQIDDSVATGGGDSRSLSLKMNALEKRAKLLGLDLGKKDSLTEETEDLTMLEEVDKIIENMPSDKLAEAMLALKGQATSSVSESGLTNSAGKLEIGLEPDPWGLD